jgi:hypothetical protein
MVMLKNASVPVEGEHHCALNETEHAEADMDA